MLNFKFENKCIESLENFQQYIFYFYIPILKKSEIFSESVA